MPRSATRLTSRHPEGPVALRPQVTLGLPFREDRIEFYQTVNTFAIFFRQTLAESFPSENIEGEILWSFLAISMPDDAQGLNEGIKGDCHLITAVNAGRRSLSPPGTGRE